MEYSHVLYQIGNYTWLGYIAAIAGCFFKGIGDKSYYYGGIVLIIANLLMQVIEPIMVDAAATHRQLIRDIWYPVWAYCDLLSILSIYMLHRKSQLTVGFESRSLVICFAGLCLLQAVRYLDQFAFETNLLLEFYKVGVNTINIGCLLILLVPIVQHHRHFIFRKS